MNRQSKKRRRGEGEGFIYVLAFAVLLAGLLTWLFIRRLTDPGPAEISTSKATRPLTQRA